MLKALCLFLISGLFAVHAQHHTGIPPLQQADVTKGKDPLRTAMNNFVDDTNKELERCSKGEIKKQKDFVAIFNLISLRVSELGKQSVCENDFIKCVFTKDVSKDLKKIINDKAFVAMLAKDKELNKKEAKQVRKFYRKLLKDVEEK